MLANKTTVAQPAEIKISAGKSYFQMKTSPKIWIESTVDAKIATTFLAASIVKFSLGSIKKCKKRLTIKARIPRIQRH